MKKYFVLSCVLYYFLGLFFVRAYSIDDIKNANALADANIVVNHNDNISAYRLDDTVSRQEVVGIAMKILGVPMPEDYLCQGYFSDAYFPLDHSDAWVCRSVEIAADNNLVTRSNTSFRPKDTITRAEALAILMKAKKLVYPANITHTFYNKVPVSEVYPVNMPQWQIDLLEGAQIFNLEKNSQKDLYDPSSFNHLATRAEVFAYAFAVMQDYALKGTIEFRTDDKFTYIAPEKDFEISQPNGYIIESERVDYEWYTVRLNSTNLDADNVVISNNVVWHETCKICTAAELGTMKEGVKFGTDGIISKKVSDTLYTIDGKNNNAKEIRSYLRYVFNIKTKTVYYVVATTTVDNWEKNQKELLSIVNSLKVYK